MINSDFETSLTGYSLNEARRVLAEKGLSVSKINVVSAPKSDKVYDEDFRVILVKSTEDGNAEIFICKPF